MVDMLSIVKSLLAMSVTNYGLEKGWTEEEMDAVFEKALELNVQETTHPRQVRSVFDFLYRKVKDEGVSKSNLVVENMVTQRRIAKMVRVTIDNVEDVAEWIINNGGVAKVVDAKSFSAFDKVIHTRYGETIYPGNYVALEDGNIHCLKSGMIRRYWKKDENND